MKTITVTEKDAGVRLDKFLAIVLDGVSRSRIQRLIEEGAVLLNGTSTVKKQVLTPGDVIKVTSVEKTRLSKDNEPIPQDIPFDILYEDKWLMAVDKPAGLVVHPGHGVPDGTLVNALLHKRKELSSGFTNDRPGIVHRLDKETSGVLLVAKNDSVHAMLAAAFAARTITKHYVALCIGKPSTSEGTIESSLGRSRREPVKRAVSPSGKPSSTSFTIERYRNGIAIITFSPHTGRTHQIRVHASSSGFPVLGDSLYGGGKERILRINPVERPFAYSIFKCFKRQALHARSITFKHPETGLPITIIAPFPSDFLNTFRLFDDFMYK